MNKMTRAVMKINKNLELTKKETIILVIIAIIIKMKMIRKNLI